MTKPFKTYYQQTAHLRDIKKINCNDDNDQLTLIRTGYFNLINGYKTPFDVGIDSDGNHKYIGGTTINHFKVVKTLMMNYATFS